MVLQLTRCIQWVARVPRSHQIWPPVSSLVKSVFATFFLSVLQICPIYSNAKANARSWHSELFSARIWRSSPSSFSNWRFFCQGLPSISQSGVSNLCSQLVHAQFQWPILLARPVTIRRALRTHAMQMYASVKMDVCRHWTWLVDCACCCSLDFIGMTCQWTHAAMLAA